MLLHRLIPVYNVLYHVKVFYYCFIIYIYHISYRKMHYKALYLIYLMFKAFASLTNIFAVTCFCNCSELFMCFVNFGEAVSGLVRNLFGTVSDVFRNFLVSALELCWNLLGTGSSPF